MKKLLAVLLSLCLALGMTAVPAFADGAYTPGEYTGTATGYADLSVTITVDENAVTAFTIDAPGETAGIGDKLVNALDLTGLTSVEDYDALDAVTSATCTMTNAGIRGALEMAFAKAAGSAAEAPAGDRSATTEVLVIGAGATGLAAAISAIDNGATDVIIVEKMGRVGGSSAVSGAVVAAYGTYYTESIGLEADLDAWLASWKRDSESEVVIIGEDPGYPTYDRVRQYFGEVAFAVNKLQDLGIINWVTYPFFPNIYYQVPDTVISDGMADPEGGFHLTDAMCDWLKEKGADIRLSTAGTKLLLDEAGNVTGATVTDANGSYDITATKGVVLATGGFAASEEMMREYLPQFADWIDLTTSGRGSTGDGMKMAVEAGSYLYNDPYVITLGSTARNASISGFCMSVNLWYRAVVNSAGERFFSEGYMPYQTTVELSRTSDGVAWAVGDSQYAGAAALDAAVDGTEVVKADTLDELAEKMGIDPAALNATIEKYNQAAETGVDPDEKLQKDPSYYTAINQAPYYAVRIYVCTGGTIGGVKTNELYQVLREDGSVIGGLYAGGETSNREMYAYAYSSGSGIGYALASGTAIGAHIMGK